MSEQSFVLHVVQESLPVWEQCLHSEFLERLADSTLDEACFKGYIVEDSLYLREYAKVFAWGMTKAACKKAALDSFIRSLPKGYDTPVGELGGALSGG